MSILGGRNRTGRSAGEHTGPGASATGCPEPDRPYRRSPLRSRSFVLLLLATFGAFCGYALLLPVVPLWAVAGGADESGAGATTGTFMLTTVLAQLSMPWLLRRASYRLTLSAGIVLLGAPAPLYALSPALGPVVAISALRGVGFGMITVSGSALVAELVPASQRGRGAGLYGLAVGLPNVFCLPLGVWAVKHAGYGPLFVLAGVLPALGTLAAVAVAATSPGSYQHRTPDPARPAGRPHAGAVSQRARSTRQLLPGLLAPWTLLLAGALAMGGLLTFLPIALAGSGAAPTALFAFSLAMSVGRWGAGVLGDRFGSAGRMLVPSVLTAGGGMIGAAVAGVGAAAASPVAALASAAVGAFLFGMGFGALQNETLVMMFGRVRPGEYGTASMVWNIAYDAGAGAGAVALGVVVDVFGFAPAFAAAGVVILALLPLAVAVAREGARTSRA